MTKSRNSGPYRSVASQMTPSHDLAVREGGDAELAGDAATALRLHRSVPMFRRSAHGTRLAALADLGADAPGWVVNRWLTEQAGRRMWTGGDQRAIDRVLRFVMPIIHPHGVSIEEIGCDYEEQIVPYIAGLDWVVRQVDVYEMGALRKVVEGHASRELLARADQIDAWCGAPMRVCRLEETDGSGGDVARVTELATSALVEVLDLGISEELEPGECFLTRIVPTVAEPGAMFEWVPLPIPERAALRIARNPKRWLSTLHHLAVIEQLEPAYSQQLEMGFTSDLPLNAWMSFAGVGELEMDRLDPDGVVDKALDDVLFRAGLGAAAVAPDRHLISGLLLHEAFGPQVRMRFARPELLPAWQTLAATVTALARPRAEEMAMWCDACPGDVDEAVS